MTDQPPPLAAPTHPCAPVDAQPCLQAAMIVSLLVLGVGFLWRGDAGHAAEIATGLLGALTLGRKAAA